MGAGGQCAHSGWPQPFVSEPLKLGSLSHPTALPQINKVAKAVAAAHTFFVANPEHVEMKQNLEYYQMMAGVRESDFADLEARPHMVGPPTSCWVLPQNCVLLAGNVAALLKYLPRARCGEGETGCGLSKHSIAACPHGDP